MGLLLGVSGDVYQVAIAAVLRGAEIDTAGWEIVDDGRVSDGARIERRGGTRIVRCVCHFDDLSIWLMDDGRRCVVDESTTWLIGRRWIVEDNVDTRLFGTVMLDSFSLVCVVRFHCSLSIVFRCLLPPSLLGYQRPFTSEVPCMCDRSKRTSPLVSILIHFANPWSDEALIRKASP